MSALGIGLSASSSKASTCAFLDGEGSLSYLGTFNAHEELFSLVSERKPNVIAIDSPLCLPNRLCCLEESCSCSMVNGQKGRIAEQMLASMRIGSFYTNKRSVIRDLIYRAIELRRELSERGQQVIEVYPYATKVKLFHRRVPAKSNPESLPFLRRRLPELINGLEPYVKGLNHDRCDALLTAYTCRLYQAGLTEDLGVEEEGYITIPIQLAPREIPQKAKHSSLPKSLGVC